MLLIFMCNRHVSFKTRCTFRVNVRNVNVRCYAFHCESWSCVVMITIWMAILTYKAAVSDALTLLSLMPMNASRHCSHATQGHTQSKRLRGRRTRAYWHTHRALGNLRITNRGHLSVNNTWLISQMMRLCTPVWEYRNIGLFPTLYTSTLCHYLQEL